MKLPLAAGSVVFALIASASAQYFNPYANRLQTYYDAGLTTNSNISWKKGADPECGLILNEINVQSWGEAKSYCEATGGPGSRIASSEEVCPDGYNSPAAFGQEYGDKWVAINDEPNGWIQIGDWSWAGYSQTCITYKDLPAVKYNPDWGADNEDSENLLYCYRCTE